jgi:hypothetical protein
MKHSIDNAPVWEGAHGSRPLYPLAWIRLLSWTDVVQGIDSKAWLMEQARTIGTLKISLPTP